MEEEIKFFKMEDHLKFFQIGRQPQFFKNVRQPKYFGKRKIKLIFCQMEGKKLKTFLGLAQLSKIIYPTITTIQYKLYNYACSLPIVCLTCIHTIHNFTVDKPFTLETD